MKIDFYKKIILGSVLLGLILNPMLLLPAQTQAAENGGDAVKAGVAGIAAAAAGAAMVAPGILTFDKAALFYQVKKDMSAAMVGIWDKIKKILGMALKKLVIDRLVDAAVQWIQRGGFEGKGGPIVPDWGAFFQQAAEDLVGEMANAVVPFLCGPFKLNVALSFLQPRKFSQDVTCSLNNIVSNIDNFFKDFRKESKGRWIAYNAIWEPENNFFGAALAVEDQKELKLADMLQQKNVEATINLGFRPQVVCKRDAQTGKQKCETVTPGTSIAASVQQSLIPNYKGNAILSADDIALYVGALLDAVIYRYSLLAIGGLAKALGYQDSDNTDTTYADYASATFNQIDAITFQNNRVLLLDAISNVIGIWRTTLFNFNQSITVETIWRDKLETLQNCTIDSSTFAQSTRMAELQTRVDDANTIIDDINTRKDDTQNRIDDLQNAQEQAAQLTVGQDQAIASLLNSLQTTGTLDTQTANQALADAAAELTNVRDNITNLEQTDASAGGYQDIISICATQLTPPVTP